MNRRRRLMRLGAIRYDIRDEFTTDLATGNVHNSAAEPGPGTRTLTGAGAAEAYPSGGKYYVGESVVGLYLGQVTRVPGKIGICSFNYNVALTRLLIGFHGDTTVDLASGQPIAGFYLHGTTAGLYVAYVTPPIKTLTVGQTYKLAVVLRNAGAIRFIYENEKWIILYRNILYNTANLYFGFEKAITAAAGDSVNFLRLPTPLWSPPPLLSASGAMTWPTTNGLGHSEGVAGGLGSGGAGLTMTAALGTWGANGSVISASELDVSGVAIVLATLNTADVLYECVLGYSAGVCGIIVRYTDANNYVYVVNDGTNVKLFEVTSASPYPGTQRGTGIKAPAAGARLIVDVSGAAARVYYNETSILIYASIADTTGVKVGLITSNVNNTFNNIVVDAKGTGGEHNILKRYSGD